jgi:hypothetical protein
MTSNTNLKETKMKPLKPEQTTEIGGGFPLDQHQYDNQLAPEPTGDPTNVTDYIPTPTPQ